MERNLVTIDSVAGMLEAEILRALLDSHNIKALLSQESAASVFGLGVGPLGRVDILVDSNQAAEAREILSNYRSHSTSEHKG